MGILAVGNELFPLVPGVAFEGSSVVITIFITGAIVNGHAFMALTYPFARMPLQRLFNWTTFLTNLGLSSPLATKVPLRKS